MIPDDVPQALGVADAILNRVAAGETFEIVRGETTVAVLLPYVDYLRLRERAFSSRSGDA